ncbi:MAG: metallophosphoesterase [Candidatus Woesearchaeota archaeon]|nr:MAG: metallophosphoesterase [Candidatus Woesearchaeota archaeon]
MVKIAVISDLHLGFSPDFEREKDCYEQAANAFNKALSEDPNLIILIGDIFHKKIPAQETLGNAITFFSEVNKRMGKEVRVLEKEGGKKEVDKIPAIITIYGTHERRNAGKMNPVHILEKAKLLYCLHKESILAQFDGVRIGIHGLSGVHDKFARTELENWRPKPFERAVNLFLIHQTFNDIIPTQDEDLLEFNDLPTGFDLYLLGHIHWNLEDKHPVSKAPILVPGSTIATQLRGIESKKEKGFYLLNIIHGQTKIKFIPIKTRPFIFEKIDVGDKKPSEILTLLSEKISSFLKEDYRKKPIFRFKLEGKLAEGFSPVDLQLKPVIDRYSNKAILKIDKSSLTSSELEKRKSFLQGLIDEKESVNKIGLNILMKSLDFSDPKLEELFDCLSEGDIESAEEVISKLKLE